MAPVLPCGLDASGARVWEDWGSVNRTVHPWRTTISWFDMTLTKYLPQLFTGFGQRWLPAWTALKPGGCAGDTHGLSGAAGS